MTVDLRVAGVVTGPAAYRSPSRPTPAIARTRSTASIGAPPAVATWIASTVPLPRVRETGDDVEAVADWGRGAVTWRIVAIVWTDVHGARPAESGILAP